MQRRVAGETHGPLPDYTKKLPVFIQEASFVLSNHLQQLQQRIRTILGRDAHVARSPCRQRKIHIGSPGAHRIIYAVADAAIT